MGIIEASAFDIDFGSKVKFTSQSEKNEMQRSKKSSKARFHLNHFMLNSENQTIKEQPKSDSNTFYSIFNHLRSVFSTNKVIEENSTKIRAEFITFLLTIRIKTNRNQRVLNV